MGLAHDELGYAIMPDKGLCGCGCGEPHHNQTFRVWRGHVWWFKHGTTLDRQSHIFSWLNTRIKQQGVLL